MKGNKIFKRILVFILVLSMAFSGASVAAEENGPAESDISAQAEQEEIDGTEDGEASYDVTPYSEFGDIPEDPEGTAAQAAAAPAEEVAALDNAVPTEEPLATPAAAAPAEEPVTNPDNAVLAEEITNQDSLAVSSEVVQNGEPVPYADDANDKKVWSFHTYYVNQPDGHDVTLTENFNLKYQMEFHADSDFAANTVVIKIPAVLFKDRDENPVKPSEIGVPKGKPGEGNYTSNRSTPFNWYYEDEREETLVFFNYKDISSGYNAAWQVLYKDQKLMDLKDGTDWEVTPEISVSGAEEVFITVPGNELKGKIDSWVRLDSVVKSYYTQSGLNYTPGLYTLSQVKKYIEDGTAIDERFLIPDANDPTKQRLNTADWRFVVWDVKVRGTATQPWDMVIEDTPDAGGEVVGYRDHSDSATAYDHPIGPVAGDGTALSNQKKESWGNRFWVVTAYPEGEVSKGDKVKNDITIVLKPLDEQDGYESRTAPTATWEYKDYDWTYSGNVIGVEKYTDTIEYTGWLNAYKLSAKSGKDYGDMPFTTTGTMYGYPYTHHTVNNGSNVIGDYIPKTYYTLTTVDDFMYLYSGADTGNEATAAQMLSGADYYFSNVTITQTDYGFDVWEGEETASQLGEVDVEALPEALKEDGRAKSKVRIYAMLANPGNGEEKDSWVLIDTVSMDEDGRLKNGSYENGQVEEGFYKLSDAVIAKQPWRIKVEHDTIDYRTVCQIDVKVRIKHDSEKMKALIEARESAEANEASPKVKFENLSGVMGTVHEEDVIVDHLTDTTTGNSEKGNYTGRSDLEDETKALYKDSSENGILLIRDNAERTVTWLNETAASYKKAKSTNDVGNNRVLVDYYLTAYDGYEIYDKSSLNYLREKDKELISPGRSHVVFYDLLPYGMRFDASAPIVAGRITNLNNNTYQTQPKSWDSTQVTVTVDPNEDIITNYRGTGRTRIAFHLSFSGADATSYTNRRWIEGWGVSFRAYYEWKDIDQLNGIDINANLSAFMPDFGIETAGSNEGHPALLGLSSEVYYDNGMIPNPAYEDMVKAYGEKERGDIDGHNSGILDQNCRNVLYAKHVLNDDVATSSESKIEKLVRADADRFGAFDRTAVVSAGGFYTYDITVSTGTGIKDIVVFDRLEYAAIDRMDPTKNDPFGSEFKEGLKTWSGEFQSVDISGLEKQGIVCTVYYNNNEEAVLDAEKVTTGYGWYTEDAAEESEDWKEKVKAVAVIFEKQMKVVDGAEQQENYVLEANKSISFQIKMKAPKQLADASNATYNNASFYSVSTKDGINHWVEGNSVKVTLDDSQKLEIIKKTAGDVPAALLDEKFEFRLYEEYTYEGRTEKKYLAYAEYELYKEGNTAPESGVYATDGNGSLYLHADEKAVFKMAGVNHIQVEETENIFWESSISDQPAEAAQPGKDTRTVTVTNTYRPVLYVQKYLSAVPDWVDVSGETFTFKIEVKRNNTYVPLKNAEFWYVNSARLDGGIPKKLDSGRTTSEGTFTIKKGEIIALFPGIAGTEYRITEPESGENWICENNTLEGTLTTKGGSRSITNYYKWKELLLTKDITHQTREDYEKAPQAFTFRICEVEKNEDGTEKLTPVTGKQWVLLDKDGKEVISQTENPEPEIEEEDGEENGETAETSGVLDEEGKFTCAMGFQTVKIKDLEAGKTYRIEELTDGIAEENNKPLYVPVDNGTVTTTMPVYSTRRNVTITNDYQKRSLSVKKTVAKSNLNFESEEEIIYYRFTAKVGQKDLAKGTEYTVTKAGGETETRKVGEKEEGKTYHFAGKDENNDVLGENEFFLADGETATFMYVGMFEDPVKVTEVDNGLQVFPANKDPYTGTLSEDGAEASFVNGEAGSLLIGKEYVGLDEIGKQWVDVGKNDSIGESHDIYKNMCVEFILKIKDEYGEYTWPEVPTEATVVNRRSGNNQQRRFEPGESITIYPWETLIIPTGENTTIPSNAEYTLIETEESRNRIISYLRLVSYTDANRVLCTKNVQYWMQISQSAESDALSKLESVSTRPFATIYNEISTIGNSDDGSIGRKLMTRGSEEVPEGKKLVWRVEWYDGSEWLPADGIPYVIKDNDVPVSQQVEYTEEDGRIVLYKKDGDPSVWFPQDKVYLNLYKETDIAELRAGLAEGKQLLRLVEMPEESDEEWGMLVAYQAEIILPQGGQSMLAQANQATEGVLSLLDSDTPGSEDQESRGLTPQNGSRMTVQNPPSPAKVYCSLDIDPRFAIGFVNSNSKASLEIEKYVPVESDQLFTMILEQVVSTSPTEENPAITSDNYTQTIAAKRPGADIPYTIHNADGSVTGSGVTGANGEIKLEAGQCASLEVSEGTMWLVSEKTSVSPNYSLKDLQPESEDPRMMKLNDNLMLIYLPETVYTTPYTVEWYLLTGNDRILLDSETRDGIVGGRASATREDMIGRYTQADGYVFRGGTPEITLVADSTQNKIELYFEQEVKYTLELRSAVTDEVLWSEQRVNYVGYEMSYASIVNNTNLADELHCKRVEFDYGNSKNISWTVLTSDPGENENVVRMYGYRYYEVIFEVEENLYQSCKTEEREDKTVTMYAEYYEGQPGEGYVFSEWVSENEPEIVKDLNQVGQYLIKLIPEHANDKGVIRYTAKWKEKND